MPAAGVPDAIALAAAAAQPFAARVLLGPADREQLVSNLLAGDVQLTDVELAALGELAEPADRYWRHRAALPWT